MKRAVLAIAAALSFAIVSTDVSFAQEGGRPAAARKEDPKKNAEAKANAPGLVAKAGVTCGVSDARYIGSFNRMEDKKKVNFDAIEVSCNEGLGYIITAVEKGGAVGADDCITQKTATKDAPNNPLVCTLAANANPAKGLTPYLKSAGNSCDPANAEILGRNNTGKVFEVACSSGAGGLLIVPDKAGEKVAFVGCIQAEAQGRKCTLTTTESNMAPIKALAAKAEKPCTVTNQRYVLTSSNGDYYEYACSDGSGFMIQANTAGAYVRQIPCAAANGIGGGCTLTDAKAALTAEAATYTAAARKAGFDCDVSKYGLFPPPGGGKEIVELACKNRPDGAVAIFSGDGKDRILNCLRAQAEGYRCSYTQVDVAYPVISGQLKEMGKGGCVVSGGRPMGVSQDNVFIEVACADGTPGWVIAYPRTGDKPDHLLSCGQAASIGGGCKLPTNTKKG